MNNLVSSRSAPNFASCKKTATKKPQIPLKKETSGQLKVLTAQPKENSEESDKEETKSFLKSELASKLKKSPKPLRKHLLIPNNMNSLPVQNEIATVCGYQKANFAFGKTIVILENGTVKSINLDDQSPKLECLNLLGRVTSMCISPDYSIFVVAIDVDNYSKLSVFSLNSTEITEKLILNTRYLPSEICISQAAEVIGCLTILEEQIFFETFNLNDDIKNSSGSIFVEKMPLHWQVTFCPADEGVICILGKSVAYLLRSNGSNIENFSTILLPDINCHDWTNDVNIVFGCSSGFLHVYRETILLDVVNIKALSENVLNESVNKGIICIRRASQRLACQSQSGVLYIFDLDGENGPVWESSKLFIIPDFMLKSVHHLSFDFTEELLLYDSGNCLRILPIKLLSKVNSFDCDLICFRHCHKVVNVRATDAIIITLDESGLIAIFSKFTNRVLCLSRLPGAFFFTVPPKTHSLFVVSEERVESFTVMLDKLHGNETIFEETIVMAIDSNDMSILAILYKTGLIVFRTDDQSILLSDKSVERKDTKQMMFSYDNKYLLFLTRSDNVYCIDISNSKILWGADYKLHLFQCMSTTSNTLLLLNQKFMVTRIKHGKDLSQVNMHATDIGFSISSERIEGNKKFAFITTDCGDIICASTGSLDEPFLIQTKMKKYKITSLKAYENELLIGYENGSVGRLKLIEQDQKIEHKDVILCSFNDVSNLKSLLRDLNLERNLAKETTETFLNLFTKKTETELKQMKNEFDVIIKTYREKVKTFESDFQESEKIKRKTVFSLKEMYDFENSQQKMKFEAMLEDQIRKTFRQLEEKQKEIDEIREDAQRKQKEMIQSYHQTEKKLKSTTDNLKREAKNNKNEIEDLKFIMETRQKEFREELENKNAQLKKLETVYEEDLKVLEAEIWALKSTCVQLNDNTQTKEDENEKLYTKVKIAKQTIEQMKKENSVLEAKVEDLKTVSKKLVQSENDSMRALIQLKKTYSQQKKDFERVFAENRNWKKRFQNFEARIEQLSNCVYNPRRLEHAVLSLMALCQNMDLDKRYATRL